MTSERERREIAQAHKGEVAGVVGPVKPRRLGARFSSAFSGDELAALQRAADWDGKTITAYIRDAALTAAYRPLVRITKGA